MRRSCSKPASARSRRHTRPRSTGPARDRRAPPTWADWKVRNVGKPWCRRYPLAIEWGLEWFYYRLRRLALFDLLELVGRCTVLVAAVFWLLECDDRTKERHYRAWELINSARVPAGDGERNYPGWSGDGGRKDALQDLNRDGISLAGTLLKGAYLPKIDLDGADLVRADLEHADLTGAKLLGDAKLHGANLKGAELRGAKLQGAELFGADLQDANLAKANLRGAWLGADFPGNVGVAYERPGWELKGANLKGANLIEADLRGADLQSAEGLTREQLDATIVDERTQLPNLDEPPPNTQE